MSETYTKCPWPLEVQSFIFAKSEFDLPEAMEWMAANEVRRRPLELLETGQSWRARMYQPTDFIKESFRTIRLGKGQSRVQAVVGCPKKNVRDGIVSERAARKRGKAKAPSRPARSAPSSIAQRLAASPPPRGMSFREWAKREGIDISSSDRRAWKGRSR